MLHSDQFDALQRVAGGDFDPDPEVVQTMSPNASIMKEVSWVLS